MKLVTGRIIACVYVNPSGPIPSDLLSEIEDGEIRAGDYNASHTDWWDLNPIDDRGKRLLSWMDEKGVTEESWPVATRSPAGSIPKKIDLLLVKITDPVHRVHASHPIPIEHSDHCAVSFRFQDTCPETVRVPPPRLDHRRICTQTVREEAMKLPHPSSAQELHSQLAYLRDLTPVLRSGGPYKLPREVIDARRRYQNLYRRRRSNDEYDSRG